MEFQTGLNLMVLLLEVLHITQVPFSKLMIERGSLGQFVVEEVYDKLLSTIRWESIYRATRYLEFGDMVIMELLNDKNLLPQLLSR